MNIGVLSVISNLPKTKNPILKKAALGIWALVFCSIFAMPATAKKKGEIEINASAKKTGDKVRGPKKIIFTHVNTLRYEVAINGTTGYTNGLDLSGLGAFLLKFPTLAASSAPRVPQGDNNIADVTKKQSETDLYKNYEDELAAEYDRLMKNWAKLQNHVNWQIDTVNEARESTEGFIRQTDSLLAQVNGPDQVVKGIAKLLKPDNGTSVIEKAVAFEYGVSTEPDLSLPQLLADLDSLKTKIITFKFKDAALLKDQPQLLATLIEFDKRVSDFIAAVKAIDRSSDIGKTFLLYQGWLKSWRRQFLSIDKDAFTLAPYEVTCSFAFSGNKENKVELFRRDRLSDAATQVSHVDITVVCSAPVSVSGGFGFSSIHESDFVFVQSTKSGVDAMGKPTETVINKFGLKNSSAFRVLPLLLVNTRVWEPSDVFALHASAGAAVDIKTGQAGTDVEYVVGPSFSFKRSLFVTPALHVGRIPSLAGGFSLGQEVPTGVSQPPLTKTWGRGFALTFTYFIR